MPLKVATVETLRKEMEALWVAPAGLTPSDMLNILDGIVAALEHIAEDK